MTVIFNPERFTFAFCSVGAMPGHWDRNFFVWPRGNQRIWWVEQLFFFYLMLHTVENQQMFHFASIILPWLLTSAWQRVSPVNILINLCIYALHTLYQNFLCFSVPRTVCFCYSYSLRPFTNSFNVVRQTCGNMSLLPEHLACSVANVKIIEDF